MVWFRSTCVTILINHKDKEIINAILVIDNHHKLFVEEIQRIHEEIPISNFFRSYYNFAWNSFYSVQSDFMKRSPLKPSMYVKESETREIWKCLLRDSQGQ